MALGNNGFAENAAVPKILFVAHGHMTIRPGGLEAYAGEL